MKALKSLVNGLGGFVAKPATARPLGILRIALSSVLLFQAALLSSGIQELYGAEGMMQSSLAAYLSHPYSLGVHELSNWLKPLGIAPTQTLSIVFVAYFFSLSFLLLGWHSRAAALAVYLLHSVLLYHTGFLSSYGADTYAHITLFYFIFFPIGSAYSLDLKLGRTNDRPNSYNRLALRLLQLHVAASYCASGIAKSMGEQWWNGEIIWRALTVPEFTQFDVAWLAFVPLLPKILSIGTLVLEVGYPLFAFLPATRRTFVVLMVSLHLGIFLGLGLHTFSLLMIFLNISLFGVSPEPKRVESYLDRMVISIRRFSWRPSGVSLEAIGRS